MKPHNMFLAAVTCLPWLLVAAGCENRAGLGPDALGAALRTHACYIRMHQADGTPPAQEIPPSCWAEEIRALHPLRVYQHRANLVVVQKESADMEEGKYINTLIASFLPRSGDDGFVLTNQHGCVYDFRRARPRRSEGATLHSLQAWESRYHVAPCHDGWRYHCACCWR